VVKVCADEAIAAATQNTETKQALGMRPIFFISCLAMPWNSVLYVVALNAIE
jgi:hypothetical protein